ncbi:hypothetical protein B5807_07401 [Epicoccum nigrum]|uniref:Uncharacterized protein n=1 Tax=Epicoccum nigrum TaxID=105696 RepID=A0A1Y2LV25_EPING|nr:hypothetical protein B5807_07401 [Epicoccum nigrum]
MIAVIVFFFLLGYLLGARDVVFRNLRTILIIVMAISLSVAVPDIEVYMNAEVALGEAFEKAKFAIGAVVVFVIATSLGADYMLASPQQLDVMHEAFERCFAVVADDAKDQTAETPRKKRATAKNVKYEEDLDEANIETTTVLKQTVKQKVVRTKKILQRSFVKEQKDL